MRRHPRLAFSFFLVLVLSVGIGVTDEYTISEQEAAAWATVDSAENYIQGRELAESILKSNPRSFVALHVLAMVHFYGDGNLPRALHLGNRARKLIESQWDDPIPDTGPWTWHAKLLRLLIRINLRMDREQEALDLLEYRDARYNPDLTVDYCWPLMKLDRTRESREHIATVLASDDEDNRADALNTLGAMEFELGNLEESLRIFSDLVDSERKRGVDPGVTLLRNAGEAAIAIGRFDEAERFFLEATLTFDGYSYSNPWLDLATLYLRQARFAEAAQTIVKMQRWGHASDSAIEQLKWADRQTVAAALLIEGGFDEEAVRLLRKIRDRPDRRAGTSTHSDQSKAGQLILLRYALKVHRSRLVEQRSWAGALEKAQVFGRTLVIDFEIWSTGRRIAALVMGNDRLGGSMRFFLGDGIAAMVWTIPELVELIGPGVTLAETKRLLRSEAGPVHYEEPYLTLVLGEAQAITGNHKNAKQSLELARATLPPSEALLKARATALLAEVTTALNQPTDTMAALTSVLNTHPTLFRVFEISLPVSITDDGTPAARLATRLLEASPRFDDRRGFRILVETRGSRLVATLSSPEGAILSIAAVPIAGNLDDAARQLATEFHDVTFAVKLDLAQTDIVSLEGGGLGGTTLRENLEQLFQSE